MSSPFCRYGFCAALLSTTTVAQEVPAPERYAGARARIQALLDDRETAALSLAVLDDDRIVWAEGFGLADRERGRRATADSIYRLASISKPFTAAAMMTLVDRGLLDLDTAVNRYLQDCQVTAYRGSADDVTLRGLCNHTAGLPTHWNFFYAPAEPPPRAHSIRDYGFCVAPPGRSTNYSNLAFGIIDHVIATVAETSFRDYLRSAVLDPLGLHHTDLGVAAGKATQAAVGYRRVGDGFEPVGDYGFDHDGASAVRSSAPDLMRFARLWTGRGEQLGSVEGARILRAASAEAMMERRAMDAGSRFGIAWAVGSTRGQRLLSHTGGMPGVSTALRVFPDQRRAIAVLTNTDNRAPGRAAMDAILPVLLADQAGPPEPAGSVAATEAADSGTAPPGHRAYRGLIVHPSGAIPVELLWSSDGASRISVGETTSDLALERPAPFPPGSFAASCRLPWPLRADERADATLQFVLRRQEPALRGVVYVTLPGVCRLPYWVELRAGEPRSDDAFRVISYNVLVGWRDNDVGRFLPGVRRRSRASAWLAAQAPDVVAFQEMNGFTAASLGRAAAAWRHPHVAMLKETGYPVALTSKTPIEVLDRHREDLHHGMLHARTAGIDFVVVHLCPRPGVGRKLREIEVAMQCYRAARAEQRPAIILGDFNSILASDIDRYSAAAHERYRKWGYALAGERPDEVCVGPLLAAGLTDSCALPGALPDQLPLPRIDFVFAAPELAARQLDSHWLCLPELLRWSDHPPVLADFRR